MIQFVQAIIELPAALNRLTQTFEKLIAVWQQQQDARWVEKASEVKHELERASNMDQVRTVLNKLSDLQRNT